LIGDGCDSLIPSRPPQEAIERRRQDAGDQFRGDFVHKIGVSSAVQKGGETEAEAERPTGEGAASKAASDQQQRFGKRSKKERRDRSTTGYRPDRSGAK
jgi:hypothetical protein